MPRVSVVIPMRNAEPFVAAAVRSVLDQVGVDLEVVVVDDGSTDRSAAVVRGLGDARIKLVDGPQRGISAAFNAGLAASTGEFLARCDADDLYPPGRLARQVDWLHSRPAFGAVCGGYATINESGRDVDQPFADEPTPEDVTDELLAGRGRSHVCAYLFRTNLLRQLGGCREWFQTSEDADLQYRLAGICRVGYDPAVAYLYRLHDSSITHTQRDGRRQFYAAAAADFLRQRTATGADDLQRGRPPAPPADSADAPRRGTDHQIQDMLFARSWREHRRGERFAAVRTGLRAVMHRPTRMGAWKSLAALAVKR